MDWITIFVGAGCFVGGLIAGVGVVAHAGLMRAMAAPLPLLPEPPSPERRGEEDARRHHAYQRTLAKLRESDGASP